MTGRAGGGASHFVDDEVFANEASGDHRGRKGLDGALVLGLAQGGQRLTRAVGAVGEDLESGFSPAKSSTPVGPSGAFAGVSAQAVTRPVSGSTAMCAL